ncbi:hypothetical protein ColKHC_13791 [Colletotrichum higginsianum]|nr:hypothetical protein ColKHC_13791 [Colletotrichum higginsianum]
MAYILKVVCILGVEVAGNGSRHYAWSSWALGGGELYNEWLEKWVGQGGYEVAIALSWIMDV